MASWPQIALRSWQFFWTLITMALIGNVIAEAFAGNPSSVNYAMVAAVFSMVVVLFGFVTAFVESLAIPIVLIALDAVATLLNFIAGVVLAAKLGVHSCHNSGYLASNSLTNGSHNMTKRCQELQASTTFFWFLFASFAVSTVVVAMSSRGGSSIGGVRRGL